MKSVKEIASEIAKREGKKSSARVGDIREIVAILSDLSVEDSGVIAIIVRNGQRRLKRGKK